jgi:hypothetical protein
MAEPSDDILLTGYKLQWLKYLDPGGVAESGLIFDPREATAKSVDLSAKQSGDETGQWAETGESV